jgi:hypothetical protein
VAGCEENRARFHPRLDLIILLSALAEVLVERLGSRTSDSFGKSRYQRAPVAVYAAAQQ